MCSWEEVVLFLFGTEVKWLAQGLEASEIQSWELNPGDLTSSIPLSFLEHIPSACLKDVGINKVSNRKMACPSMCSFVQALLPLNWKSTSTFIQNVSWYLSVLALVSFIPSPNIYLALPHVRQQFSFCEQHIHDLQGVFSLVGNKDEQIIVIMSDVG